MTNDRFTKTDYYDAALLRCEDFKYLRKNTKSKSVIFALYCAGVAVECMLRAYMVKNNVEFDAKHDLEKLYLKSQMAMLLNQNEKEKISTAIRTINKFWKNDFRYTSEKRLKRILGHELAKDKPSFRDINKYFDKRYTDIFKASEIIIKIGEEKWT